MSDREQDELSDAPKTDSKDAASAITRLPPKQLAELVAKAQESDDAHKQNRLAFTLFCMLGAFLILLIVASVVLHSLNIPELRILETASTFAQGALTTILGFLFGTKIYKK